MKNSTKGISIIEILIVIAILAVSFASFFGLTSFYLSVSGLLQQRLEANFLAQDAMEAIRNFRDETVWGSDGLGTLAVGLEYHPQKTAGTPLKWTLTPGAENIGIFTRKAVFERVFRDSNDNIAVSGAEDLDSKKAVVLVSWPEKGRTHSVELITYFTNWRQ